MSPDVLPLRPIEAETPITEPHFEAGDHSRLIDRAELARRLSVGVSTLDRLRATGKVGPHPIRVGGAVRFRMAEVASWLAMPTPSGELHDTEAWAAIQRRAEK